MCQWVTLHHLIPGVALPVTRVGCSPAPCPQGAPACISHLRFANDQLLCQLGFHVLSETLAVNLAVLTVRG